MDEIKSPVLESQFKDHIVDNPITNLKEQDLPIEVREVHLQPLRNLEITIQVLDEDDGRVIETITGKATGGSIKMDSTSLIRRTGSISLSVDPDLFPKPDSLMWFGHYIRVYAGLKDLMMDRKTYNFLLGTFWIDEGGYSTDSSNSVIDITLSDKMTRFDERELEYSMEIPAGVPISEAMRLVMENIGETNFGEISQNDGELVVPYKLQYEIGESMSTIITAIRDMYMDCVCGYDVMGNFEFKQIAVQREDDASEPKWRFDSTSSDRADLTLSFQEGYNLKAIRNHVVVYGGTSEHTGLTPVGEVKITDPKSPFNVDAIGTRKKIVIEDKLMTNDQCISKARFDIWKMSNFQETARITTVPIYILDANDIIEITHPETGEVGRYQIDSFDLGLDVSDNMTIEAHKLYYIGLEYGEEMIQIVEDFIRGINNYGWLSLAEERIKDAYNIVGSGVNQLTVRFTEGDLGGTQASVQSYATTKNQTLLIDIKDFEGLDPNSESGANGRSKGDYADRVLGHEMFHAVMNDYLGHDMAIQMPEWFKESWAEFIHGGADRFNAVSVGVSNIEKRNYLSALTRSLLGGSWSSSSDDYIAAYLIAIAIYRIAKRKNLWKNFFINLRGQSNISINFLAKMLPIADTNNEVRDIIIAEIEGMNDVWTMLFDTNDTDTGSIGGYHFMNLYGVKLNAENVFNNANATTNSIGFNIKIEK